MILGLMPMKKRRVGNVFLLPTVPPNFAALFAWANDRAVCPPTRLMFDFYQFINS